MVCSERELFAIPFQLLGGERLTVSTQRGQIDDSLDFLRGELRRRVAPIRIMTGNGAYCIIAISLFLISSSDIYKADLDRDVKSRGSRSLLRHVESKQKK